MSCFKIVQAHGMVINYGTFIGNTLKAFTDYLFRGGLVLELSLWL